MVLRNDRWGATLSLTELARQSGCHPDLVERLAWIGVIDSIAMPGAGLRFETSSIARLRRAMRLRRDLGINANSLGLVLDLLERIEDLEDELNRLKAGRI